MHHALRSLVLVAAALLPLLAAAQRVAFTFDDGLDPDRQPRAAAWYDGILEALAAERLKATFFVSLRSVGGEPGLKLVDRWSEAGHAIGNHTARHRDLGRIPLDAWLADVEEADRVLRRFTTFQPRLRFPFLKEGDTREKRDGVRAWMRDHGYKPAPVSIDASDWYYDGVYRKLAEAGDDARLARLKEAYVAHLLDRARFYDGLARKVLGRSPSHVMLLHTNAINAAWLRDVMAALKLAGWTLVDSDAAFADPLYTREPGIVPAGESIVWALAKEAGEPGLRYPAEDGVYEEPILRGKGLLP